MFWISFQNAGSQLCFRFFFFSFWLGYTHGYIWVNLSGTVAQEGADQHGAGTYILLPPTAAKHTPARLLFGTTIAQIWGQVPRITVMLQYSSSILKAAVCSVDCVESMLESCLRGVC